MSRTVQESSTVWPKGVVARYLTRAAEITGETITVDVKESGNKAVAVCRGCGADFENSIAYSGSTVVPWAERHAEKCRALPRPEGS